MAKGPDRDVEGPEHPAASPPQSARALSMKLPSTVGTTPQRHAATVARGRLDSDAADQHGPQTWSMARRRTTLVTDAAASSVLDTPENHAAVAGRGPRAERADLVATQNAGPE